MSNGTRCRFSAFPVRAVLASLVAGASLLLEPGCTTSRTNPPPARTHLETAQVVLPAQLVSNFFIIETKWDGEGPFRMLIDTGSSATLVSADLAKRFKVKSKNPSGTVAVRSANGGVAELESVTLRRLWVGAATFDQVPARVYDFGELSNHLGMRIDAAVGFPVFRDTLLTLDYPNSRLILTPRTLSAPQSAGTVAFNNERSIPLIPVQLGNESFVVLVDSGSDGSLSLNPVGLHPKFAFGPRPGPPIASLAGDRSQMVGRLNDSLLLGSFFVERPLADLTDELSSIGGELLRHFTVTFDQKRNQVTFSRSSTDPVRMSSRRTTGLSFVRTPAYWRVLGIVPETPACSLGVQPGDLCVRVNGEPVERWTVARYEQLFRTASSVSYAFLAGTREDVRDVPVIDLVP